MVILTVVGSRSGTASSALAVLKPVAAREGSEVVGDGAAILCNVVVEELELKYSNQVLARDLSKVGVFLVEETLVSSNSTRIRQANRYAQNRGRSPKKSTAV